MLAFSPSCVPTWNGSPDNPTGCWVIGLRVCLCVTEAALRSSPPKRAYNELIVVLQFALGGSYQTGTFLTNCKTNPVEFKTKAAHIEFDMNDSFDVSPHG